MGLLFLSSPLMLIGFVIMLFVISYHLIKLGISLIFVVFSFIGMIVLVSLLPIFALILIFCVIPIILILKIIF